MEENRLNDNQISSQEEGLSLKQLFYIVKKHILSIIVFIVLGVAGGFAAGKITNKLSPKWTATGSMMVTVQDSGISATQAYQYSSYISKTFVVFVKEDIVLDKVAEEFKDEGYRSAGAIRSSLSVSLKNESLVMGISFTSNDKDLSKQIILSVIKHAETVSNYVDEGGKPRYPLLYGNLSGLSDENSVKIGQSSNTTKYTLIGGAVGVVVAFAYVALREAFDNSFRSSMDIEKELGIPVIAEVPYYEFQDENAEKRHNTNKEGK